MPNGTQLNNVFAARIHKSNAEDVREEAAHMLDWYKAKLLVIAAMPPATIDDGDGPVAWPDYIMREIPDIIDGMRDEWWREWAARYIVNNPGDCKDDLVEADRQENTKQGDEG